MLEFVKRIGYRLILLSLNNLTERGIVGYRVICMSLVYFRVHLVLQGLKRSLASIIWLLEGTGL